MSPLSKVLLIILAGAVVGGGMLMYNSRRAISATKMAAIATSTEAGIHHVALTSKGASPADLLIKVGEYVEFDSKDGAIHDIASGAGNGDGENHAHDAAGLESGDFKADEGYKVQFKKIGSYFFHDHLHPTSTISIAVYDPGASSTPL